MHVACSVTLLRASYPWPCTKVHAQANATSAVQKRQPAMLAKYMEDRRLNPLYRSLGKVWTYRHGSKLAKSLLSAFLTLATNRDPLLFPFLTTERLPGNAGTRQRYSVLHTGAGKTYSWRCLQPKSGKGSIMLAWAHAREPWQPSRLPTSISDLCMLQG
jgi:hypothetical protein